MDATDDLPPSEKANAISNEESWEVIRAFFQEKGLVSQQIDSYNHFVDKTIDEIVNEHSLIILDQNSPPPMPDEVRDDPIVKRRFEVRFQGCSLSKPLSSEPDGQSHMLSPQEARLRGLTYSAPLFMGCQTCVKVARERPIEGAEEGERQKELVWEDEQPYGELKQQYVGRVPVMLRSKYCMHNASSDDALYRTGECPFDSGGYFIINGSEKVLIAQERSAANIVQVFKKKLSPTPFVAEIRSAVWNSTHFIHANQALQRESGDEHAERGLGSDLQSFGALVQDGCPCCNILSRPGRGFR